jgi:hypothetical protein
MRRAWQSAGSCDHKSYKTTDSDRAAHEVETENDVTSARKSAVSIVIKIQRADYEGDRAALDKLYEDLVPFVDQPEVASRLRYWRGFAKWRRAINGFNETPTPTDLAEDLTDGESEFDAAIQRDPSFVHAKVGAVSCILLRQFAQEIGTTFATF